MVIAPSRTAASIDVLNLGLGMSAHNTVNPRKGDKPLLVPTGTDDTDESALARAVLEPTVNAAITTQCFNNVVAGAQLDLNELVSELSDQCAAATRGDLARSEAILVSQAHTLDALFNNLAKRALSHMGRDSSNVDRYFRYAFKAQNQCRMTLETLRNLRNPPMVIAKQANVTTGPQQIHNGVMREFQPEQGKLLEQTNGERLDTGATCQAIGSDPALATVGTVHRTAHG